jgi:ADP-ribose pyrophosphatase
VNNFIYHHDLKGNLKLMKFEEIKLDGEYIYKGRIINLRKDTVRLPNGKTADREVIEHPGGVCLAPLTENGELIFVSQFRYPFKEELLELPAGKLTIGEDPLECGIRELKEETGTQAENYVFLGKLYPSPGCYDEIIYLYLAQGLTYGEQQPDEDEFLEVIKIPLETAVEMVLANALTDAKTQTLILKTYLLKQKGLI